MAEVTSIPATSRGSSSTSFQRAVEKFEKSLTVKQRQEFTLCSLDDVHQAVVTVQERRGGEKTMRNMARLEAFLEGMDQYRKVVEVFLNCTPFLGYVWGPIRFILLVADTFVSSFDTILDAYGEIGERIPSLVQYESLFERNPEMRRALELYYCDILEFHYNALRFLSRPGWKRLFSSAWKTFDTQFQCILNSLSRHKNLLESEKGTIAVIEAQRIRELAETSAKDIAELEKKKQHAFLIEKLDAPDYQRDQRLAFEQRWERQSGSWVLQDGYFRQWSDMVTQSNPLLYIHGIPGAGKTILASLIIDHLQQHISGPVLFFYCKHDQPEKNTFSSILRGLLSQMVCKDNALTSHLYEMCSSKDQAGMSDVLEKLAEIAFDSQTTSFVILDGLDECISGEAEKAISWFLSRHQDDTHRDSGHVRLLCIGQRIDELQSVLSSAADLCLENASHQEDIERYVEEQACRIKEEFEIDTQAKADIVTRVTKAAKCMFLFARLVMENLLDQTSQYDVVMELEPETFPVNLKDAYERVVSTMFKKGPQQAAAMKITRWVACAKRPLKWREIQASFFIQPKMNTCDYRGRKLRKGCKKLCGSLIDLQRLDAEPETEAVLHLVHDTARDYLLQQGLLNLSLQHNEIALFCTEYLLSTPFHISMQISEVKDRIKDGYYAFQDYAVSHWYYHMTSSIKTPFQGSADILEDTARQLKLFLKEYGMPDRCKSCLKDEGSSNVAEILWHILQDVSDWTDSFDLGWRTSCIRSKIESLKDETNFDDAGQDLMQLIYGTRLFKCSRIECSHFTTGFASRPPRDEHLNRHDRPFKCVEQHCPYQALGFETEAKRESHLASHYAGDDTDKFLFPQPPRRRRKDDSIHKACARGDIVAVKDFLDGGACPNLPSASKGRLTPLTLAARISHLSICKMLVENGADVNFRGQGVNTSTALHEAALSGATEVVHYFLSLGHISINERNSLGMSPLHYAAEAGREEVVRLLLTIGGVDPDIKDNRGGTPLSLAALSGHETVVKLLLATGKVDPDIKDRYDGRTLLSLAAESGHETVVKLLLATGKVDLDIKDNVGRTPLSWAAQKGHETVVKLLLATGKVDPDDRDDDHRTPTSWAAETGHEAVVELLLATGKVDPNIKDDNGRTLLRWAAKSGHEMVVKSLLATGKVDPDIRDKVGRTPLSWAAQAGYETVVKLLLATGDVDPGIKDNYGRTPLVQAKEAGREAVVKLLLAAGAKWVEPDNKCFPSLF